MVRCPNCRRPLADSTGLCPYCGHDLDKHAWLLGSIVPGEMRRGIVGAALVAVAVLLVLLVLTWR